MPRQRRPHIETKKTRIMTGQINCHQSNWRYQYRPLLRWLSDFQTLFCCQAQSPGGKIVAQPTNCISYRPYTFVIGIKRHMRRTICLVQFLRWILSTNSSICLHRTPPRQRWKNIGIYQPWEHLFHFSWPWTSWTSSSTFDTSGRESSGASNSWGDTMELSLKIAIEKWRWNNRHQENARVWFFFEKKSFGFSGLRFWEDCKINLVDFSPGNVRGALQKKQDTSDYTDK